MVLLLLTQALEKTYEYSTGIKLQLLGNLQMEKPMTSSPWCGNADLCVPSMDNMQLADVKSISGHAHPPDDFVGHFHCPSYVPFASSFSSSSSSVCPAQPMSSLNSPSTTSSKGKGQLKLPLTSPRHQDNRHSNVSNSLQLSSSPQNNRNSSAGMGCFHNRRKKKGKKLGGFLFLPFYVSQFNTVTCLLLSFFMVYQSIRLSYSHRPPRLHYHPL